MPVETAMPSPEVEKQSKLEFFVTHHSNEEGRLPKGTDLEQVFLKLKEMGVNSHRFDMRWQNSKPEEGGQFDQQYLDSSAEIAQKAEKAGLSSIIVLSTAPKWALEMYKSGEKEKFFAEYKSYLTEVKAALDRYGVHNVSVQVFNELNNAIYTPQEIIKDLPQFCGLIKEIFGQETKITGTLLVGNLSDMLAGVGLQVDADKFMQDNRNVLMEDLDTISLDFYPGLWHWARVAKGENQLRDMPKHTERLKRALQVAKTLGKEIEIGEVGFPTLLEKVVPPRARVAEGKWRKRLSFLRNFIPARDEWGQRYATDIFARAIYPLIHEFGIKRIGFYQVFDEQQKELGVLNFGMWDEQAKEKAIVPRLPAIIRYLRRLATDV